MINVKSINDLVSTYKQPTIDDQLSSYASNSEVQLAAVGSAWGL